MQLSAATLPLDPASAPSPALPGMPGFGATGTESTSTPGAFGALLTAESEPTPPAASAAGPGAVPFSLGLNSTAPAVPAALLAPAGLPAADSASSPAAPSSGAEATAHDDLKDRPFSTAEEDTPNANDFADWLAAHGFSPPVAAAPTLATAAASVSTPESAQADEVADVASPTVGTGSAPPQPPAAVAQAEGQAIGRNCPASQPVAVGEGTSSDARSSGESIRPVRPIRGSQVRATYSRNPTQRQAVANSPLAAPRSFPAAFTAAADSTAEGESTRSESSGETPAVPANLPVATAPAPAPAFPLAVDEMPAKSFPQVSAQSSTRGPAADESAASSLPAAPSPSVRSPQDTVPELSARVVRSGDSRSFLPSPMAVEADSPAALASIALPGLAPSTPESVPAARAVESERAWGTTASETVSPGLTPSPSDFALPSTEPSSRLSRLPMPTEVATQSAAASTSSSLGAEPPTFFLPAGSRPAAQSPVIALPRTEEISTPSAAASVATPASQPSAAAASSGVTLLEISATTDYSRENFAVGSKEIAEVAAALEKVGLKKTLSADKEVVTDSSSVLGINAAKSRDAMTSLAPNPVSPSTDDPTATFSVPTLDFAALVKEQPQPTASEFAGAARRTVESVLAVSDRFTTTGGQHGVNLKFMVSGIELAVRVEVRGGTVQTTFRTDSPELRAALAVQWHAAAATSDERSQRLAEPVFTSSSGRDSLQSDHGSADQRGARQGQSAPESNHLPRTTLRRPPTVATVSVPVPLASVSTSSRLHTFA